MPTNDDTRGMVLRGIKVTLPQLTSLPSALTAQRSFTEKRLVRFASSAIPKLENTLRQKRRERSAMLPKLVQRVRLVEVFVVWNGDSMLIRKNQLHAQFVKQKQVKQS